MDAIKTLTSSAALAAALLVGLPAPNAIAQGGPAIGVLSCSSIDGTRRNLLIYSSVELRCVFNGLGGRETYRGKTGIGLGVDLNWNRSEVMNFAVLGAVTETQPGSYPLAGGYFGGKVSATLAVGAGAGALVGAGSKNVSLQPLTLEGSTGLGVAGGLSYLFLEPAR